MAGNFLEIVTVFFSENDLIRPAIRLDRSQGRISHTKSDRTNPQFPYDFSSRFTMFRLSATMSSSLKRSDHAYVYCKCCLRNDEHSFICNSQTRKALTILTLGFFQYVEPIQCDACGNTRMRGFSQAERWKAPKSNSSD